MGNEQRITRDFAKQTLNYTLPSGLQITGFEIPNICPNCRRLVALNYSQLTFNKQTDEMEALFVCNFSECLGFTVVSYSVEAGSSVAKIKKTDPPILEDSEIPLFAREISESFVLIFQEALEAKARGLSQIAGPGFRKAIEFLIKDYAKKLISETDPNKKSEMEKQIERKFLGQVVNEFISDPRVQKVAKRAIWIGNDETHYLRKFTDQDITDLVTLTKLTLDWVEIERLSAAYEEDMPDS